MPSLAATLKAEVRRHAAREVKRALRSLKRVKKQVRELRLVYRAQRRDLDGVKRRVARLKRRVAARRFGTPKRRRKDAGPRISPQAIRSTRARLGMTRVAFAKLVGASPGSIFGWEKGRTTPRGTTRARLVRIKKMGARAQAKAPAARRGRRGPGRRRRARA